MANVNIVAWVLLQIKQLALVICALYNVLIAIARIIVQDVISDFIYMVQIVYQILVYVLATAITLSEEYARLAKCHVYYATRHQPLA